MQIEFNFFAKQEDVMSVSPWSFIKNQKGQTAIIIALFVLAVTFFIALAIGHLILNQQQIRRNLVKSAQAYYAAESGVEDSLYRIIKGKKYEANNTLTFDEGSAEINIADESGQKIVVSKGIATQRVRKIRAVLKISGTDIAFHYGAQVGRGGLRIQNNARIIGNVYSNGSIDGAGTTKDYSETCPSSASCITDDVWVAGGVAPDPDQQWTSQNSDFPFGIKVGPTDYLDTAQSFIPSTSEVLNIVSFYIKKVGSPPDQTVKILTNDSGSPSTVSLGSGTLKSSKVTTEYSWIDVSLDPSPSLTAGFTYWIMIDAAKDNNNYWIWGKDSTDSYLSGTGKYTRDWTRGTGWTDVGGDLNFKTWMGGIITYLDGTWVGVDAHANSITDSNITNDAYYQTSEDTFVHGISYPGSPDPATKDLPISYAQIQDWEAAAQAGGVIDGNYNPPDGSSLGPIKINGSLTFPSGGTVTITGPVWVTGKILAENNVIIKLQEGLAAGYPIIADNPSDQASFGQIELNNNVITQDATEGGKLLFVATNRSTSLFNPAIWLHNNVNKDVAQSIIFSLNGLIVVENNAKFKEITGYGLYLANNAEIVYEAGLIHASFSSGPGAGWTITDWRETQ
ncbi:hypothetical protein COX21_01580 [Candidatus Falkowbacteria bacterium CG23_combo_of_CG06-09_8_20_14_all_41_10]|uniref:Uncharacterized protein n=2 Tax=Parcubacteria group TaxID=1794811 RepID=A0A2G9ZNL4_9BACT|nr:MAG: hypothetical protein COX21_01580 [Candidatus Falkowbacteria bacterium CG23_combo_of_CG06-09_8_20_14_all_41_10]